MLLILETEKKKPKADGATFGFIRFSGRGVFAFTGSVEFTKRSIQDDINIQQTSHHTPVQSHTVPELPRTSRGGDTSGGTYG